MTNIPKLERITTPNVLEVSYLLDRHHKITDVTTQAGWPYGIEELAVTLEGENIDLDHHCFMNHGEIKNLAPLSKAFDAIQNEIWRKAEAEAIGGRL